MSIDNSTKKVQTLTPSEEDPLRILNVIQKLEVGPVQVRPNRLICPYSIQTDKGHSVFNLIYRFEEDVFDARDHSSVNLASMIAAQVAINYGLFCEKIVFNDRLDKEDIRFIEEMMVNTAREIYVMKFLRPNPFLLGKTSSLPFVKKDNYVQASLGFPSRTEEKTKFSYWGGDKSKHAVLSSGGKDSLLSFGLLKEIGKETHAIFINESGRHWYTALNGYRYLRATYPETARVWTNSDRLFSWMLRHLPFVRQDFARVRSDDYPIRLWTVAVFLFGALPLLKKRGIGRIVIGDEFDSTNRSSHQGITHYNGLFDQSRYFDNTLTRYYYQKGWDISQFSVIRTLSELLIEKTLYERYPFLQRHQVSCHATHIKGDRVFPCGKCEKCRRIVGMLTALDANPTNCGYTLKQTEDCLKAVAEKGVHQESAAAQHLSYLLSEKGILQKSVGKKRQQPQPEIMKIRIDNEKSPIHGIPVDLRKPLYKIFLKHADGISRRQGRIWIDYDLLKAPELLIPYPFESPDDSVGKSESVLSKTENAQNVSSYLLAEMTWPEAQVRFKEVDVALLPVGSLEQHGLHLPVDTDAFDADYLARRVADACQPPKPLVLPLIPYGVSYHHEDFSGTLSISPKTLTQLIYEVGMSAARNGITKLVIIKGHGGNIPALQFAAQMINRDAHIFTCVETGETSEKDIGALTETPNDVHAGEVETSTSLANRPHLVKLDKAKKFIPRFSSKYLNFSSKRSVEWNARVAKISTTGVLGDPTKASREKGEKIWEIMIKHLVEFVEDLNSMSLDEIYHKRF
jgi:creatinine amidohydrolase/Fe(II)-dependent formamide hydrolase-like protein/7-cyano-7-deazaguanine synthase in queuosine biosynthesis